MSNKQNVESYLGFHYWQEPANNTITVEQALLGATALSVTAVDALVAANKVIIKPPNGQVAMELRFYGDGAENVDDVVELCAAVGEDHYRHFAQLTITVGTQDYGSTYHFHDTVVPTNEAWLTKTDAVSPENNTFGTYIFNIHGHDSILVIASDLDCTLLGVEYRTH